MKKLILTTIVLAFTLTTAMAQKPAQIKFEKTSHDFGSFSESNPKVSCVFAFENVGEQPLVINQANCLHCGNCMAACPAGAIERR